VPGFVLGQGQLDLAVLIFQGACVNHRGPSGAAPHGPVVWLFPNFLAKFFDRHGADIQGAPEDPC
jgi:hypothetical protein